MPLLTKEDFGRLFKRLSIPAAPDPARLHGPRGLAWFGEEASTLTFEDAQKQTLQFEWPEDRRDFPIAAKPRAFHPVPPGEDDDPWEYVCNKDAPEGREVHILRSPDLKLVMAVNADLAASRKAFQIATLLYRAMDEVKPVDITGNGKNHHPFRFELLQNTNLDRLRMEIADFLAWTRGPSERWAVCCHSSKNAVNLTVLSFDKAQAPRQKKPTLIHATEFMPWDGEKIPPTVCFFWWNSQRAAAVTGTARKKPGTVRVRVVLTPGAS